MRSPAVTSSGYEGEPYPAFQARVAEDAKHVKAKCDALDKFTPRCIHCGETCDPIESGSRCKENGATMVSRWAYERAKAEWYRLGNFGGAWSNSVDRLAVLLDLVRAEASTPPADGGGK